MSKKNQTNDGIEFIKSKDCIKNTHDTCYKCNAKKIAYGEKNGEKISCKTHKKESHVNISDFRVCIFKECSTKGTIGIKDNTSYRFCKYHISFLKENGLKEEYIIRTKNSGPKCSHKGCSVLASFDGKKFCKKHSPTSKSDDTRSCEIPGCNKKRPTWGLENEKPTRCIEHKTDDMICRLMCIVNDCKKSASFGKQGESAKYCKDHMEPGCKNVVSSMCCLECHPFEHQGKYPHPEFYNKRICSFATRMLIEDAYMKNDNDKANKLKDFFGLKEFITLNPLSCFRIECEKNYKNYLDVVKILFDISPKDGPKCIEDKRPDIFYKWEVNGEYYGIHIEYDEKMSHEDDTARMEWIAKECCCTGRVYVIRVCGRQNTSNPVCKRILDKSGDYEYYVVTENGKDLCFQVSEKVKERISWIKCGIKPTVENMTIKLNFN